ncbi:MAG: L,D-transpeptidase family protein [Lachnospiraceae bacterium]
MGNNKSKKKSAFFIALLLTASILFGSVWNVQNVQAATGDYYIKINKGTNVVTVYKQDGTPYTAFTCSTGYATPVGTFHTMARYRWWTLDGPSYGQYCTRITGSILFHSVWYYQQTKNSQSYTQYNKLGTTASHGCCRLTVSAAKWIYDNCPVGTKVIIFNGSAKDDPLGKPKTIKVKGYSGWDPTDPDEDNPYKTKSTKPVITVSKKTIAYGSKFGDGNMSCKDSGGFDATDWVKMTGKVNTKKIGSYPVTYSIIDSFGRTATKKVTYKVVDNKPATLTGVKETITKECGNTRNMLVGLKAKDAAGVNLTSKISVYIKAPESDSYEKCADTHYTFTEIGTYYVKYVIKNPNNGLKTTKKQTITVTDTQAPVLTCKNDWSEICLTKKDRELYWDALMKDVTATLSSGKDITDEVEITITAPSGECVTILESQSYTFREIGTYTLVYKATNPNAGKFAKTVEQTRSLTVTDETQAEVVLDE